MDRKVAIIIPALDEAGHIGELVSDARSQQVTWVIVVDNGSTDGTAGVALSAGAIVITEPRQGYGYACAAGTKKAQELGADVLAYMDGDYSSLPDELPQLLTPIWQDEADLVIGSRILGQVEKGAMMPHQRFGNWLVTRLMIFLYGVRLTDLGPYRAIKAPWMASLSMEQMTFGWPTEMMVKVAKRRGRIVEVPVSWRSRRSGRSKISGTIRGSILAAIHIVGVTLRHALD